MRYKLEKLGCYVLIIVLLPYIVTVFLNGPVIKASIGTEDIRLKVKIEDGEVSDSNCVEMSVKDYGIGILAREIPASYNAECIKAQAIIVRTRLYRELSEQGSDTILDEKFFTQSDMEDAWGIAKFAGNYNKLEMAWQETEGQVLVYDGKLIYTPFFSLSNGNTRDGKEVLGKDYPYLKIKDCPLDIEEADQLQTIVLDEEIPVSKEGEQEMIEVLSCDTAGYVLKVRVGEEEVNGEEFRKNYNLASSCFSVQEYEGKLRITTRGVGHGIGLSQNTANKMAESGKTAEEILEYFFEGSKINEVADMVVQKY